MNVNLLALSVGNTRTHIGVFQDGKLLEARAVACNDKAALAHTLATCHSPIADAPDACVLMASVNPHGAQSLIEAAAGVINQPILRVEKDIDIPIGRQLDRESIVGEDRLLCAAAAYDTLKQACVVVDAGTAITVDLIDGQGTFHGGAIGPGANMMLQSLHQHTAQLPEVTFAKPEEPIGHNTAQAMRTAVFHGLRGMVRELTEKYAEHIGSYPIVIATGGDAPILFEDHDLIDRVVPDLALLGLRVTLQAHLNEENAS